LLSIDDIRAVADKRLLVGASTHSLEEARAAEEAGADWVIFGPVYDTPSKRRYGAPQGLVALERVTQAVGVPVIAIGGVTPERVAEVCAAGARGVAVISAILAAEAPAGATRRFLDALARAGGGR
jgi:thiamine-phosphate pyrophosphorylase